jgi:hypothetical protein
VALVVVSREDLFPVGTVVAAYRAAGPPPVSGRPPYGPAAGSEMVDAGGVLTYTSLTENAGYILYAPAPDRYLNIFVSSSGAETSQSGGYVATNADLPVSAVGHPVVLVLADSGAGGAAALRYWDGDSWELLAGTSTGGVTGDYIDVPWDATGLDGNESLVWDSGDSRFEPGAL